MQADKSIFPVCRPWDAAAQDSDHWLHVVEIPKRVRVIFGGETIADSRRVLLLREADYLPAYYFVKADVRSDLLTPTDFKTVCPYKGAASYWTLKVRDRVAENAAWSYLDPPAAGVAIKDCFSFEWAKMDRWVEEEEEVFVHARDPYKRIDALQSSRHVRVEIAGETIAETRRPTIVIEPGHPLRYYVDRGDVRMELLEPSHTRSHCPYKGVAAYWSAWIHGKRYTDICWSYVEPRREFPKIKDLLCFFQDREAVIHVDGEQLPAPKTKWSRREGSKQ